MNPIQRLKNPVLEEKRKIRKLKWLMPQLL